MGTFAPRSPVPLAPLALAGPPRPAAARPARSRGAGFALIVVLAFVVLLTTLLVAYFSRSVWQHSTASGSFNQAKADELARSALDLLTSDLKQEIADPNASTVTTANNVTVYTPLSNAGMVPVRNARVSGNVAVPNLIRISTAAATPPPPGVDQPASSAPSTGTSKNGKTISLTRWNKHYLVPLKNPGTPTDTTPIAGFTAPSWVFVTSDAGPATPALTKPSSAVIGRYAYAMYDESGLLDMNVAGYPIDPASVPTTPTTTPAQYGNKGALAFANLTRFITSDIDSASGSMTPLLTQLGINNLIGWRNFASMSIAHPLASPTPVPSAPPAGTFPNLTFSGSAVPTAYSYFVATNTNGFLQASATPEPAGKTDQALLTRQQLISLAMATGTANFNPAALQFLGTFSRALAAPSWVPTTPSGSTIDYHQLANSPTPDTSVAVNRSLANVRFSQGATITHYDDQGVTSTYVVQAGDPLLQRRFSLAKIAWLAITPAGPNLGGGMKKAIEDCFGLDWDAGNWRWEYSAAKPSPGVGIKTLDLVAQENREPNFFELLKAGILDGSLGRDPGKGHDANVATSTGVGVGVYASAYDTYKTERNLQILQIGANIIDQFDTDSYPTAIHLNTFGLTGADDLCVQTVYGIENLPYLESVQDIAIADPVPPGNGTSGVLKYWFQPVLWNPHQVPSTALQNYPSEFRAYAYGSAYGLWYPFPKTNQTHVGPTTHYQDGGPGTQLAAVYFISPGDSTSPFYNYPVALTLDLPATSAGPVVDKTATPSTNYYDASKWSNLSPDRHTGANFMPNQFAGIAMAGDPGFAPMSPSDLPRKFIEPSPTLFFSLQYKGPNGSYHPYNFMGRLAQDSNLLAKTLHPSPEDNPPTLTPPPVPSDPIVGMTICNGWGPERPDPRTDRFSASLQWFGKWPTQNGLQESMNYKPNSYKFPIGSGFGGADCGVPYFQTASPFNYVPTYNPALATTTQGLIGAWALNDPAFRSQGSPGGENASYSDPDGIVRYGDSYRENIASGDGSELYNGTAAVNPGSTIIAAGSGSAQARRPMVLNRACRSVGEIGFAYRDLPFKTIDLWSPTSADAALLDLFCVSDLPVIVAGQINPSSVAAPTLRTILAGTFKSEALAAQTSDADVQKLCDTYAADVSTNGAYRNRAELATRLGPLVSGPLASDTSGAAPQTAFDTRTATSANWANKPYAEAPMRALADVTNTRTWNIMIDVIAQSGVFVPGATDLSHDFVVQGERRYWLHVAIDRFTGNVIDQQLEPVYE